MWKVCDSKMQIVSEWASLSAAKDSAKIRSNEYPGQVYFVCDGSGMVWAGF